jgi:hypothetical protein
MGFKSPRFEVLNPQPSKSLTPWMGLRTVVTSANFDSWRLSSFSPLTVLNETADCGLASVGSRRYSHVYVRAGVPWCYHFEGGCYHFSEAFHGATIVARDATIVARDATIVARDATIVARGFQAAANRRTRSTGSTRKPTCVGRLAA